MGGVGEVNTGWITKTNHALSTVLVVQKRSIQDGLHTQAITCSTVWVVQVTSIQDGLQCTQTIIYRMGGAEEVNTGQITQSAITAEWVVQERGGWITQTGGWITQERWMDYTNKSDWRPWKTVLSNLGKKLILN